MPWHSLPPPSPPPPPQQQQQRTLSYVPRPGYLTNICHLWVVNTLWERCTCTTIGHFCFPPTAGTCGTSSLLARLLASFPCKLKAFRKTVKNVVKSKVIGVGDECKLVKWCEVKWGGANWCGLYEVILFWSEVRWSELMWFIWSYFVLKWSEVERTDVVYMKLFCFEVKWGGVTVKFLGTKVPCTLGWPYTEGTWLYCDYIIWYVSCTVVVLTGFVMCGCVYVWVL